MYDNTVLKSSQKERPDFSQEPGQRALASDVGLRRGAVCFHQPLVSPPSLSQKICETLL